MTKKSKVGINYSTAAFEQPTEVPPGWYPKWWLAFLVFGTKGTYDKTLPVLVTNGDVDLTGSDEAEAADKMEREEHGSRSSTRAAHQNRKHSSVASSDSSSQTAALALAQQTALENKRADQQLAVENKRAEEQIALANKRADELLELNRNKTACEIAAAKSASDALIFERVCKLLKDEIADCSAEDIAQLAALKGELAEIRSNRKRKLLEEAGAQKT